tara:strand:+ start:1998 stop:2399 length:402 start_codon:yes stop_codon:yes gene_type:complete
MIARKLQESDWSTLQEWWSTWPKWEVPPRDFLPDNGTGGFIVEKDDTPIVAGFVYLTNSKGVLLEWLISNPEYRENDRDEAIETLIMEIEKTIKNLGYKFMFTITQHNKLIETHKKLGWKVDTNPSYELTKVL